jgi:hypothetical protein
MQRSSWHRATALVVNLWFLALSAGLGLTPACPAHKADAAMVRPHGLHTARARDVSVAAHHGSDTDSSGSKQCTCLGRRCCSAPVAVATEVIALLGAPAVAIHDGGLPDYAYVPVAAQHVLPLANAPPLSA